MGKVLAQASATVGKLNDGTDGRTSYIHVAYANSADGSTNFSTTDATGRAYIGTLTDFIEADSTNYADYTWSLAKGADGKDGADGIPGQKGEDGKTSYIHFAYANSADGSSNFSTTDPTGKAYVGTLTDFTEADSTNYADYTWSLIKGADGKNGATGAQGPKGADGRTSYIHVAYSNSSDGSTNFSTTDATGRAYVGTLTDFTESDSTNYKDYTWSLIKGSDGKDGSDGIPGPKGSDGRTSYVHFAYANSADGSSNFSTTDHVGKAYVGTLTDFTERDSTNYTDYTWSLIKGADGKDGATGAQGPKGADGRTSYIHVAYANSTDGSSNFSTTDPTGRAYVGTLTDFVEQDSTNPADYTWSLVKGSDGKDGANGLPGPKGTDGRTSYVHFSYANSADGTSNFSVTDPTGKAYVGTLTDFVEPDSTNPADYTWSLIKGADGKNGATGAQGPKGDSVTVTSTSIQYAISTSGTSTPTQWSNTVLAPEQGKFLWTRTTVTFSDGKSTVSYSIAFSGSDGKVEDISGIVSRPTPPEAPKENQFWNDTSTVPNMLKVYRAGTGWVAYQFSAENIAAKAITTDKLAVNAVKAANIDMSEVTYQVADSSKNITKNSAFSDETGLGNSAGWTLSSGVTLVEDSLGDTNGILIPAGTTATIVNDLWDSTDAISDYVLGLWLKSTGAITVTVDGVASTLGGTNPITLAGDGNWTKSEIKYTSTSVATQLKLTVKAVEDTYLARVMLARRDTRLDGMWLPAPEDGMLNTTKINEQVTQNFSLSNGQLKSIITNLNSGYSSNFTQNSDGTINQITKGNDLVTAINTSPAGVYIKGSKIQLDGTVSITQDFYAKGGNFKNLNADNITSGKVKADYIDVSTVMTMGLSTTNATIGNTLTMGGSGKIVSSYTKSDSFTDLEGKNINYTLVGKYTLSQNGMTLNGKATGPSPSDSAGAVGLNGVGYIPNSWTASADISEAAIYMSATGAKGYSKRSGNLESMPSAYLQINPYFISVSGGSHKTSIYASGIVTDLVNADLISVTDSIFSAKGIKSNSTIESGPIRMNGYHSIFTTDGTGLYLAGGGQNGGAGVQVSDDFKVTGGFTANKNIAVGWDITKNGTGFHPAHFNNLPGIHIQGTNAGISFDEKNKYAYFILGNTWYRMASSASGSGNWDN